jgi:hypothetical protein
LGRNILFGQYYTNVCAINSIQHPKYSVAIAPCHALQVESEKWSKLSDNSGELRAWEVESLHPYECNLNVTQVIFYSEMCVNQLIILHLSFVFYSAVLFERDCRWAILAKETLVSK